MAVLPISTQESLEKVQPHGYVAPPFRLFTQSGVPADRLAACQIGRFLRFGISPSFDVGGVGEGHKAAAERRPLGCAD
jgi:hypothetical protein